MNNIKHYLKAFKKYLVTRKTNERPKRFYKKNKNKKYEYVQNIWNKNYYWDYFYQHFPGSVKSDLYVPQDYYGFKMERLLNDSSWALYVNDKNMYDKLFRDEKVKFPKTIFRCSNSILFDRNYERIENIETVISAIDHDIIVKKTIGSKGGDLVDKYIKKGDQLENVETREGMDISKLIQRFGGEFIVQECIQQHPVIGQFHPASLNTLRFFSYRSVKSNETIVLSGVLRIGTGNRFVDNVSSGGIPVGLKIDNGTIELRKNAFDREGECFTSHPDTGIAFEGTKIPGYPEIERVIKKFSNLVAHQRLIGWDFCVDSDGNLVLIELNTGTGINLFQRANGKPLFGEYSKEIKEYLDELF